MLIRARISQWLQHAMRFFGRGLTKNVMALYGVHFVNYLLPLLTVPYLGRTLGPHGWGQLAFAQAFATFLLIGIEYGFGLSATREIARHRQDPTMLANLFAGVLGAKVVLALGAVAIAAIVGSLLPILHDTPQLRWAAIAFAVAQGLNVMWYFQGLEKMKFVAQLDVSSKIVGTVMIFVLVHSPGDGWMVLVLSAMAAVASTSIATFVAYRRVPFRLPTVRDIRNALLMGRTLFVFRASVSMFTTGTIFILGLFAQPQVVGYYAGAEKLSRAAAGLLGPMSQALYPRVSGLVRTSRTDAARLVRMAARFMAGAGLVVSVAQFAVAPFAVHILLGSGFEPSVTVLRILAPLPLLVAISNLLGTQWMLPLGLDGPFNGIIILAGTTNLVLAIVLAPIYADLGMAVAVVVSETFVVIGMAAMLWHRHLSPYSSGGGNGEDGSS